MLLVDLCELDTCREDDEVTIVVLVLSSSRGVDAKLGFKWLNPNDCRSSLRLLVITGTGEGVDGGDGVGDEVGDRSQPDVMHSLLGLSSFSVV